MWSTSNVPTRARCAASVVVIVCLWACGGSPASPSPASTPPPPFGGTIFIAPDIIRPSDPTTLQSLTAMGLDTRRMFDRRVNNFVQTSAYIFAATFSDGLATEVQVNAEFGSEEAARVEAQKYAFVMGQLPRSLRVLVAAVVIHQGIQPFGGGGNSVLIHTGQGELYERDGILEETLVHEAAHTSLDPNHYGTAGWAAAVARDGRFISTYARDFPSREDIAESFVPYLAVRFRSSRISPSLAATIQSTMPNRIAYFDAAGLVMAPIQ